MKKTIVNLGLVAILVSLVIFSGCINGGDGSVQNMGFTSQATTDADSNYTQSDGRNYITLSVTTNASGNATNIYGAFPKAIHIEKIDVDTGSLTSSTMSVTVIDVQTEETILSVTTPTNRSYYPRVMIENYTGGLQRTDFDKYFVAERVNLNIQQGGGNKTGTFKFFYS